MEKRVIDILLIEDDHDDAELAIYSLKKFNIANNLVHIDDGAKALRFLYSENNSNPQIILLDLKMPGVDGIEILKKLKNDPDKSHIPVIVLISSKEGKNYLESFHVKPDAYLLKPVDFKKFFNAVNEIGITWKIISNPVPN